MFTVELARSQGGLHCTYNNNNTDDDDDDDDDDERNSVSRKFRFNVNRFGPTSKVGGVAIGYTIHTIT